MSRGPGKGKTNNPNGRPPGPNKVTSELKEFYVAFVDANREKMQLAADRLYEKDPYHYLIVMDKMSQKVIANKRDITSDDKSIIPNVTIIENRDQSK